ncbi:MAG: enoyl-CoA hydratase/isomerase family protein [Actinomycetia bacterium]|nr:enoyl-CoA hydratase/isomerase family protein [Actinomycetes bacterium]
MDSGGEVLFELRGRTAVLTLNRPEALNALNDVALDKLERAFDRIDAEETIRAAVITGAGGRAFTVGIDFAVLERDPDAFQRFVAQEMVCLYDRVVRLRVPVIAAVEGLAYATGAELPMCCDIAYAGEGTTFCLPDLSLGLGFASSAWKASEKLNRMRLAELAFTGAQFSAQDAYEIGLLTRVVAKGRALETALDTAEQIEGKPEMAVRVSKQAFSRGYADDWFAFLELQKDAIASADFRSSVNALLERRASSKQGG